MPTLPAFTQRTPPTRRSSWTCVWPATTMSALTPPRIRRSRSSGCERRDHVEVVLRRGMAEEDVSQPGQLELDPLRQAVEEVDLLGGERGEEPLELAGRWAAFAGRRLLDQLALDVAAQPADAVALAAEPLHRLGRKPPAAHVATGHDP